ncbi:MAG TPA: tRNA (adenosine(37)-N6)-dimethylallyltransferase MiaA [Candidatus Krumholzibacteria bacterium]|nr:tRNA (adenosine(37)-N6)-dimethylallyltransferase MiaA [Candidatus Krumholzibacteria bacterium]
MSGGIVPAVVGPTAVGKTGLILDLAERHPIEVVSLDSRQVYRGFRLGTAQPTAAERARCPHHLVDFLPADRRYSAQRFRQDALQAIADVRARGNVPLLVGGAGLYLTALRDGFLEVPGGPEALAAARAEMDALSDDAARARLAAVDPATAARLPAGDLYRIRRALEIHRLTGRPFSAWRAEHAPRPAGGLAFPSVLLTREREDLRDRIARRTDLMLRDGWLEETRALRAVWPDDCPGLRTLGYAQLAAHLAGEGTLETAREAIVLRTRQYAKRQLTWFRREEHEAVGAPQDASVRDALERLLDRAASA